MNESINSATGYGRTRTPYNNTYNYSKGRGPSVKASYWKETKSELSHFRKLNPSVSVGGILIKSAAKIIDIAVIAPFKIAQRLLFK